MECSECVPVYILHRIDIGAVISFDIRTHAQPSFPKDMIRNISLKFGRAPGLPPQAIQTTPVTVFVGPNFSGKSKVLAEVYEYCRNGQTNLQDVILAEMEFVGASDEEAEFNVKNVTLKPLINETMRPEQVVVGKRGIRMQVDRSLLVSTLKKPGSNISLFCQWFLTFNTLMLDGKGRIDLIRQQQAGDLSAPPHTSLQVLFRDDARRAEVRRIIHDAFGLYFVIDPTNLGQFRIRLSAEAPATVLTERGIHDEAVKFHSAALHIDQASDGVKAFTGIICEVIAGDPKVLLIDEPEAFLHPSLAFNLGKEMALASMGSEKRFFVATHSANFVMGCIQSGAPVNIIQLTYRGGVATARVLSNTDILKLMRNPLLRSTGVLNALFYEFVVVTEGDADRAFYQEINERLARSDPKRGIPNCLFINAQNKQTIQTIIRPLRQLGIPAAAIVDIDVVKEGGVTWTNLLSSAFVPELSHIALGQLRSAVNKACLDTGKDMKRDGGVEILSAPDKEAANNLFDQLAEYGIFVVHGGELEVWLKYLGATGKAPHWLIQIFEKMGEDPTAPDYVQPGQDDVWSFIGNLRRWFSDPKRKGIPA